MSSNRKVFKLILSFYVGQVISPKGRESFCHGGWRLLVVRVLCLLPMPNQGTHLHHSVHALYLDENPKRRRGFLHTVHQLFLSQKLDIVCLLVRARQSLCLVEALLLSMKSRGAQC